jgi:hypothetical protein
MQGCICAKELEQYIVLWVTGCFHKITDYHKPEQYKNSIQKDLSCEYNFILAQETSPGPKETSHSKTQRASCRVCKIAGSAPERSKGTPSGRN